MQSDYFESHIIRVDFTPDEAMILSSLAGIGVKVVRGRMETAINAAIETSVFMELHKEAVLSLASKMLRLNEAERKASSAQGI